MHRCQDQVHSGKNSSRQRIKRWVARWGQVPNTLHGVVKLSRACYLASNTDAAVAAKLPRNGQAMYKRRNPPAPELCEHWPF